MSETMMIHHLDNRCGERWSPKSIMWFMGVDMYKLLFMGGGGGCSISWIYRAFSLTPPTSHKRICSQKLCQCLWILFTLWLSNFLNLLRFCASAWTDMCILGCVFYTHKLLCHKYQYIPLYFILCILSKSGYTQENICNLNHHCNDDCNSSLEWSDLTHKKKFVIWMIIAMMIVIRL